MWVIDTNVVLDLLHFDDPAARPIRRALESGQLACRVTAAMLEELRRVLGYPEFALDEAAQARTLERYRTLARCVEPPAPGRLPRCRDADDQKFVDLAAAVSADVLVSKDRALLQMWGRRRLPFRILTPEQAVQWLGDRRNGDMLATPQDPPGPLS